MNISKEKVGACRWKVIVDVPSERVQAAYEEVLSAVAGEAEIDGFRKGRAPRALVEKKYGKTIAEEVKETLRREAYRAARDQEKFDVVAIVDIEDPAMLMGQSARYVFMLDVAPEFQMPEYKSIPVKSPPIQVTDEEVAAVKADLLTQRARWEPVSGRAAQLGDMVIADYEAVCEGKPLSEWKLQLPLVGAAVQMPVVVGETPWIPGLGKALVGAQAGEKKEIEVEFPPSYEDAALAGKKCVYSVTVKEVQEKKADPPDEAFYARYGVKTDAELGDKIREVLRKSKENQVRTDQKNQIFEFLLQRAEMELPQSEVEEEIQHAVRQEIEAVMRGGRREELTEQERDELIKRCTAIGVSRVKLRHILKRIAQAENIETRREEVLRALAAYVMAQGGSGKDYEKIAQRPEVYSEMENMVRGRKVSDWLLEQAKVETVAAEENKS